MKYIVVLCDGVADTPSDKLGGKTPLEVAKKPNIDRLAKRSLCGIVHTVPDSLKPGSDVANLSVMGYDPTKYYTGRSPLEALSMGIDMAETDLAVRCNLVTLSNDEKYTDKTMLDYSAGEISTEEASELINAVQEALGDEKYTFYSGVSYRHCLIARDSKKGTEYTPPHDILDKKITDYLPAGLYGEQMLALMEASWDILADHPINQKRIAEGKRPANSIWLWGEGTRPMLPSFYDLHGKKGAVISAVDLLKGIGIAGGMDIIEVEGATGTIDTNFDGKAQACVNAIRRGIDYVYLHMEATDECGHQGDAEGKVRSIELIDEKVVGYIMQELSDEEISVLICPDHPTPLDVRTHTRDSVPFMIYNSRHEYYGVDSYTEYNCRATGLSLANGQELIDKLFAQEQYIDNASDNTVEDNEAIVPIDVIEESSENDTDGSDTERDECDRDNTAELSESAAEDSMESIYTESGDDNYVVDDEEPVIPTAEIIENDKKDKRRKKDKSVKEKAEKKAKKPLSPEQKKKRRILIISIAVTLILVLTAAILTPTLIITLPQQYIGNAADLTKEVKSSKKNYLLKRDVTVDGDANLVMSIDTNGHILKINGTLTIDNTRESELKIGNIKGKQLNQGGKIIADKVIIKDSNSTLLYADISAKEIEINNTERIEATSDIQVTSTLSVNGTKATLNKLIMADGATLNIADSDIVLQQDAIANINAANSKIVANANTGNITMDSASTLRISGNVYADTTCTTLGEINGGLLVFMRPGSKANTVRNSNEIWMKSDAVQNIINVPTIEYIRTLNTPVDASITTQGAKVLVNVPAIDKDANKIQFRVEGKDAKLYDINAENIYDITELVNEVGSYDIEIILMATNSEGTPIEYIISSEPMYIHYEHEIKLGMPTGLTVKCDESTSFDWILSFNSVNGANGYEIKLDSHKFVITDTTYNLSQNLPDLLTVGTHAITVTAINTDNSSIQASDPAVIGFTIIGSTDKPVITMSEADSKVTISWGAVANAARYEIKINGKTAVNTSECGYTLILGQDINAGDTITVIAIGKDGYANSGESNSVTVSAATLPDMSK